VNANSAVNNATTDSQDWTFMDWFPYICGLGPLPLWTGSHTFVDWVPYLCGARPLPVRQFQF